MTQKLDSRGFYLYLGAVFVLGGAILTAIYLLLLTGLQSFFEQFVREPLGALRSDPGSALLLVLLLLLIVLLVLLVVYVGARTVNAEPPEE